MAFLQSQPPREPFLQAPASVLWLIGALALAHIARMAIPAALSDEILAQYAFIPAHYSGGLDGGGFFGLAAPFVSHMFLHADFVHLGVNCIWLLAFGPIVARRYGTGLFLLFFAICGVAGAAAYLAFDWGSFVGVIGASGAISGLMAAGIRMYPWPGAPLARPMAPIFSSPILLFTAFWLATNLLFGLLGIGANGEVTEIAWQAHLGGYFAGLVLAGGFEALRRRHTAKRPGVG
ncbi:MAG TPA: rhomboid family intramembrane serine protease [Rhizomicrobium sp.]